MPVWLWIVTGVLAALAVWRLGASWWKYRGNRVVQCPENVRPAGVKVQAGHAALSALRGKPELHLSSCTRWPEKAGCGQECLAQIRASSEDCLVRNVVSRWFNGKNCVNCGQTFGAISWASRPPALMGADKRTVEWGEVPADKIYEVLAASEPVCFACHTAFTMAREHPELIVNRHRVRQ